ncbi:putative disease resistance protein RGA3 [Pistacia vera]|uniref:putative disease resistance protein RGA3 n=1 Tax=Pistacia vera TaxID=55513 RepID=UPI001263B208|nr:putative disease resistance protein RGA3 [Pistacia vera]
MAEYFLFQIAAGILLKISFLANRQLKLSWALRKDLRKLEETLSIIKAVLLDAEEKQIKNHELSIWLGKLKDIFYDAEDVLDEVECDSLRRKVIKGSQGIRASSKRKVSTLFSSSNPVAFRLKIGRKIKEIRERLDVMAAAKSKLHLTARVSVDIRCVLPRERAMMRGYICILH